MRYIFMDEAGTSAVEPVTVVVGLIAPMNMFYQRKLLLWKQLERSRLKDDFVFHAAEIYGGLKYKDVWSITDRLRLLNQMMSVPRKIGISICVSAHWRNAVEWGDSVSGLSASQLDHVMAFNNCIAVCDRNIRRHAGPREVATVVAEDIPEMRRFLKIAPRLLRENPMYMSPEYLRETIGDQEAGYLQQSGELRVTRIRNSVHFVEKAEDPLVQVADACAYGFRRFFAGEKFGVEFVRSIVLNESVLRNFSPPCGTECYWISREIDHTFT